MTAATGEPSGPAGCVIRRVGVVGLGHMGRAFAVTLAEDGYQVSVYDRRDPKRIATLIDARPASQLAGLAAYDMVVTSLPDDDALADVALGPEEWAGPPRRDGGSRVGRARLVGPRSTRGR